MRRAHHSRRFYLNRVLIIFAFAAVCLAAGPTTAPTNVAPPVVASAPGKFEKQVIRGPGEARPKNAATSQPSIGVSTFDFDGGRVVLALGAVLLLIYVMRFVLRRFFPHVTGPKTSTAMRVLTRMPINPKQQLLLVQVGRRMVVVGDSGTSLSQISEITDPDEVAGLLAQLSEDHRSIETRSFVNLFGKARQDFDEEEVSSREKNTLVTEEAEDIESTRNELNGLISKVRDLSSQYRKE